MMKAILQPYLQKALDLGLKVVKVWLWIIILCFVYVAYSSKMWYDKVQENAELQIELVKNKSKIDSLKIYQNLWKKQNDTLRAKIQSVETKIKRLDKQLTDDLRNDKNSKSPVDNSDDNALRIFTKRHGIGSARYYPIRADSTKNPKRDKPR